MALKVSEVSAIPVDDDDNEGAETTNHLTEPPRRAASTEAISPIPPGGEITTTSGDEVCATVTSDEAAIVGLRLESDDNGLLLNPLIDGAPIQRATTVKIFMVGVDIVG
mmetsp:Transcript_7951/g.11893  ORF Transcript_7951/g.11893 Transcript_7951/m.11893 type:complete len:109 (-) Transcript_7951:2-328(-)